MLQHEYNTHHDKKYIKENLPKREGTKLMNLELQN